jgi:hypothetical protein
MSVEQGGGEGFQQLVVGLGFDGELHGADTAPTPEELRDAERYSVWLRCGACNRVGKKAILKCAFGIAPGMPSAEAASKLMETCQRVIDGNDMLGPYDRRTPIPVHGVH